MNKGNFTPELEKAKGRIEFGMTNDYMFRALFQKNNKALRGLVGDLLHLPAENIQSVEVTNPIQIGETIEDKEFRLDIKAVLNDYRQINLEMQTVNYMDWPERSISYLSRMFDNLTKGELYIEVKPAVHIGILTFSPFKDEPVFYSRNLLMDVNTHRIYSDKFAIDVLDLTQVELATKEDKEWNLDFWARLFKSETWEELKMIAKDNEYFMEASNTLHELSEDFNVRERCRNRQDYENMQKHMKDTIESQARELDKANKEIASLRRQLQEALAK